MLHRSLLSLCPISYAKIPGTVPAFLEDPNKSIDTVLRNNIPYKEIESLVETSIYRQTFYIRLFSFAAHGHQRGPLTFYERTLINVRKLQFLKKGR